MKKAFYFLILSIIIISGCKKKDNLSVSKVARLLKGYDIEISYDKLNRIDTMFMDNGVLLFFYNDANQLIKVYDEYLPTHNSRETRITYVNDVPAKGNLISITNFASKIPSYDINYDSIKFITENKLINQIEYYNRTTKHFSYTPNGTPTEYNPNYKSVANVSRQNGNLTDFKDGDYEYKYEYGTKKSCGFANKIDLALIDNHWKLLPILTSNNELQKVTVYNKGVLELTELYEYTYNHESYPITITVKRNFSTGNSDTKGPVDVKYAYE